MRTDRLLAGNALPHAGPLGQIRDGSRSNGGGLHAAVLYQEKFDSDSTAPVPAGSDVIPYANKVHYECAKSEEAVIQVWGMWFCDFHAGREKIAKRSYD